MKISYNWLKDYLPDLPSPEIVAQVLTEIGLEVEDAELTGGVPGGLKGLIVGEVVECGKHPGADKLSLTKVNIGTGEFLQIVCGAPNVAKGQKVIVATVGTDLFPRGGEKFRIKRSKIRGEESQGMICAEDEIGIGKDHDGIVVLPENSIVGTAVSEILKLETDTIFTIGLTPNRADAFSHIGTAKDLAAALAYRKLSNGKIKLPVSLKSELGNSKNNIRVEVKNSEQCRRYCGIEILGVKVGESPDWLKKKLNSIGVRSINNIVDITNFILHEYGQPLHAFDAGEITSGKVVVQNLPEGTLFVTLDGVERKLRADDLMICNGDQPMCMAGVFGGLNSGVKESTTDIFLESAIFNPVSTRRTSFAHNLRTDAAIHFEKGIDPGITAEALLRAADLIMEIAGGKIIGGTSDVSNLKNEPTAISFSPDHTRRLLGTGISDEDMKSILTLLGFEIHSNNDSNWDVIVPSRKLDVHHEADLAEEIIRIYGLDNVPVPNAIRSSVSHKSHPDRESILNSILSFLSASGYSQIINNSFTNSAYYVEQEQDRLIRPLNSLNSGLNALRPALLFPVLETISGNIAHNQKSLRLFECGKIYFKSEEKFIEQERLGIFITGKSSANWNKKEINPDIFLIKGAVASLFSRLGILADEEISEGEIKFLARKKTLAVIAEISERDLKKMDIRQPVWMADIDLDFLILIAGQAKLKFQDLPRFPSVHRDLALLIDESVSWAEIHDTCVNNGGKYLRSVELFDVFSGDKIGAEKKSYALTLRFYDEEKTLTDFEVENAMKKLVSVLKEKNKAQIR